MAKTIRRNEFGFSFEGQAKSSSMNKEERKDFLSLKKLKRTRRTIDTTDTACLDYPAWVAWA